MSKLFEAVTIPKWGIEMTHGRIVEWRCAAGDAVTAGDELVDIETDKIVNSFEARASGTLARILIEAGEEHSVGTLIGVIALGDYSDEALEEFIRNHQGGSVASNSTDSAMPATAAANDSPATKSEVRIAPALRRKLDKAGITVAAVTGTGPGGRIVKEDVDRALAQGSTGGASDATSGQAFTAAQQKVAASLSHAQSTVPIYHVRRQIHVGPALESLRNSLPNASGLLTLLITQSVAAALDTHRELNVQFDGNAVTPVSGSHVALAVAREDGAVAAPVLTQVTSLADEALADAIAPLVERARAGRLTATDVQPAAIAVSNLGMFGVDDFTAMVTPPQVMVLSVGRVQTVPVWHEASASFVPQQRVTVVLGSDHRVVNGAQAAQFLASVAEFIEGK